MKSGRILENKPRGSLLAFLLVPALTGLVALLAVRNAFSAVDTVARAYEDDVVAMAALREFAEREASSGRAFLFAGDERSISRLAEQRASFHASLDRLSSTARSTEDSGLVRHVGETSDDYQAWLDRVIAMKRGAADPAETRRVFEERVFPAYDARARALALLSAHKQQELAEAQNAAVAVRSHALLSVVTVAVLALAAVGILGARLRRLWRSADRQQAELAQLLERLEQSNRDLEAFTGRVAHDVRNALQPIAFAAASLAASGGSNTGSARMSFDRAIERARGLVDSLLAFSRAGRPVDPNERASALSVIRAAVEELGPVVGQVDATVEISVADGDVRCSPALLHIVATNLIGNALKFMRERDERRLRISSAAVRGGIELRFDDTGPGIPEEAREHVFDPFFRVPGTRAPGVGIGLATVRRIVDAYGGRVTFEPGKGGGTSFRVWLPAPTASLGDRAEDAAKRAPSWLSALPGGRGETRN
jgi:signal transduction histidine kinase